MQTQHERELDAPDTGEWTDADIKVAVEGLTDDIINNNMRWDENLENQRLDMLIEFESIVFDLDDDKEGRLNDAKAEYVGRYAHDVVNQDFNKYCSKYCEE